MWISLNSFAIKSCYPFPVNIVNTPGCLIVGHLFSDWWKWLDSTWSTKFIFVCWLLVWREGIVCILGWLCTHNHYSLASWVVGYENELNFTAVGKLPWDIKLYFVASVLLYWEWTLPCKSMNHLPAVTTLKNNIPSNNQKKIKSSRLHLWIICSPPGRICLQSLLSKAVKISHLNIVVKTTHP